MGLPFAEMEKTVGVITVENQMLILAVFTLRCRLHPPHGDIEKTAEYESLEFKGALHTRNVSLKIINMWTAVKVPGLHYII